MRIPFEVAHQSGLVPGLVVLLLWRKLPKKVRLLSVAWAISWAADSVTHYIGGGFRNSYFWLPVQISLVLFVFIEGVLAKLTAVAAVAVLTAMAVALTYPGPDFLLSAFGSIAILEVARGPLAVPVYVYFGLGTLAYLVWAGGLFGGVIDGWNLYQNCRLVTYALFVPIVLYPRTRKAL